MNPPPNHTSCFHQGSSRILPRSREGAVARNLVVLLPPLLWGRVGEGGTPRTDADMADENTIRGRMRRYAQVTTAVGGLAARLAGERYLGWTLDRDPYYLESSMPGVFVAGDVRADSVKRVASAVGEGAMAVTLVHRFLEDQ